MAIKTIDIRTGKPELLELLSLVEEGTEIIFIKDDSPIVSARSLHNELPVYIGERSRSAQYLMNHYRMISAGELMKLLLDTHSLESRI